MFNVQGFWLLDAEEEIGSVRSMEHNPSPFVLRLDAEHGVATGRLGWFPVAGLLMPVGIGLGGKGSVTG